MNDQSLEQLFEEARQWQPSPQQAKRMLRAVDGESGRFRRKMVRWVSASLASAATIGAIWLVFFSPDPPRAWALADVARIMRQAPNIKRISAAETSWSRSGHYWASMSEDGSRIWYQDLKANEIAHYDRDRGEGGVIFLNTADPRDRWVIPNREGQSHLERFLEEAANKGQAFEDLWNREKIIESGKSMIKITLVEWTRTRVYEHIIDRETGMIVRSKSWNDTIRYEYPDVGPQDIYDLGVPRDARVIDARATPELLDLRDRVVTAMEVNYGPHVMMKIQSGGTTQINRYVSDGVRYRTDEFSTSEFDISTPDKMALVAKQLIDNDLASPARANRVFDGQNETQLSRNEDGVPVNRYVRDQRHAMPFAYSLRGTMWCSSKGVFFSRGQWSAQWEYLGPDELGREGMRILSQANHLERPESHEIWYDPSRGHVPSLMRWLTFPDPEWQLNPDWHEEYIKGVMSSMVRLLPEAPAQGSERVILEWDELASGVWYPKLSMRRNVIRNDDGEWVDHDSYGFDEGQVVFGRIIRRDGEDNSVVSKPIPSRTYIYVLAKPLENLEDSWFSVPDEWLAVPVRDN